MWPGVEIPMTPVSSSNVEAVAWRQPPYGRGMLLVWFKAKGSQPRTLYTYTKNSANGTPREEAEAMLAAPSQGVWLDRNVKKRPGIYTVDGPYAA